MSVSVVIDQFSNFFGVRKEKTCNIKIKKDKKKNKQTKFCSIFTVQGSDSFVFRNDGLERCHLRILCGPQGFRKDRNTFENKNPHINTSFKTIFKLMCLLYRIQLIGDYDFKNFETIFELVFF